MKTKCEKYIDYINENILPRIDYAELQKSYGTPDKSYAKGVLNLLHSAMKDSYGTAELHPDYSGDMDKNFVVIPGVVQGKKSGNLCLALLEIDLSSSGEHWATDFLTEFGVIPQRADENIRRELTDLMVKRFIPYEYGYTAQIPGDIHVKPYKLPEPIKNVLQTFRNFEADLLPPETKAQQSEEDEEDMER